MTRIKFSNGITVNFNGNPTQADIEEISKQFEQPQTPAGQFDVPTPQQPINHQAKLAQLQQTVPQQTAQANAQQGIVGTLKGTGKELFNTLSSSEQALGQTIGNTLATDYAANLAIQTSQSNTQMGVMFLRHIKENQALGKDTTRLKQAYNKWRQSQPKDLGLPELPTNEQAAGQLAGVALDLLTSGSYGKATVGMESGKLANQGTVSGLLAKTGIPSSPFKSTLPSVVQGVTDVATKPAGLFTKQGATAVAKGSGIGYGYDVSQGLQGNRGEDRTGAGAFIPGANTLIAGGIPAVAGLAQSVKNIASPSFNENLNKALPVLKKDVKTLPTKQKDAYTAFSDIVANKKDLVLDENGVTKNPRDYTFNDTVLAQGKRLKELYKQYSAKLSGIDKTKFEDDIYGGIFKQLDATKTELEKTNSLDSRRALTKIANELGSLRDLSPEGIQKYIEDIGQKTRVGAGQAPTLEQIKYANLGGELRKILDNSVEKIDGTGYQDLRNVYKAHKTIESQLLQAAKSELNKTPGWTDRLSNLGMTAEGINFLLTHDPHSLAVAGGIKGSTAYIKWLRSPQRALSNMFGEIEKAQKSSARPLTPIQTNQTANIVPKTIMSPNGTPETYLGQGIREGKQIGNAVKDYAQNPKLGLAIKDITKDYDTVAKALMEYDSSVPTMNFGKGNKMAAPLTGDAATLADLKAKLEKGVLTKEEIATAGRLLQKEGAFGNPLIQEAKKYKTAEEFVNNVGSIRDNFDWSYLDEMKARKAAGESYSHSDFNYLSKIEATKRGKESRTFYRAGSIGKDGDIWLTPQEAGATQYGSAGGTKVGEYKVATQNPLILQDVKSIEKVLGKKLASESNFTNSPAQKQAVIDYAKKNGYDSVLMPDSFPDGAAGMESLVVWDKNLVKTKSQLTDIWNKAHSAADDLVNQAKKYKTAEEFMNSVEKVPLDVGIDRKNLSSAYRVGNTDYYVLAKKTGNDVLRNGRIVPESKTTIFSDGRVSEIEYRIVRFDKKNDPNLYNAYVRTREGNTDLEKIKSQLTDIWKQAHPESNFSPEVQRIINMTK